MNKSSMKNVMRLIVFMLILCLTLSGVYRILSWKESDGIGINAFYKNKKNSMDVMFYGSSHCYDAINQAVAWRDYGIAGYNLAQSGQPFGSTCYYLEESLKTQKPKAVFLECGFINLEISDDSNDNMIIYKGSLAMKLSSIYMKNVKYQMACTEDATPVVLSEAILKYPIIHNRYSSLTKMDFDKLRPYSRGFCLEYDVRFAVREYEKPKAIYNKRVGEISEIHRKCLDEVVEVTKKNGVELCLWIAPWALGNADQESYNALQKYAKENDIKFLNFNTEELINATGFDYATDLQSFGHVNYDGSEKVTKYMCEYIKKNWDVPDRRNESGYELWEKNARAYELQKSAYKLSHIGDLEGYLENLKLEDYVAVFAFDGLYDNGSLNLTEMFSKYGITLNGNNTGQVFAFKDGKMIYQAKKAEDLWHTELGEYDIAISTQKNSDGFIKSNVNWNGTGMSGESNSVTIYLMDQLNERIVDVVSFAPIDDYKSKR